MTFTLHGIGVSRGIAIGKVHLIDHTQIEVNEFTLPKQSLADEILRFENAVRVARQQLKCIHDNIPDDPSNTSNDIGAFIEIHLLMLEDSSLVETPIELIKTQHCNAEWALKVQCDKLIKVFEGMDDPYLSSRKEDVQHVVSRIQRILRGYTELPSDHSDKNIANSIVLADDLTPADTVLMQNNGVLAFATEYGGKTSHTAILARSLGIPAIVGLRGVRHLIQHDDILIVDGFLGVLLVNPDEACLAHYHEKQQEDKRQRTILNKIKRQPCNTLDGTPITLYANIEFPEDMTAVKRVGGKGVGLYRTEFLYVNRDTVPDEEEHFNAYRRVVTSLKGAPVTIRTLDLGADKQIDGGRQAGSLVTNPALGLRAIRLCLRDLKLFKAQVRAIYRASALGPVKMMIPMVSSLQEIQQVQQLIKEVEQELQQQSIKFDPNIPLGVMVEVPAMALCIDLFAPHVDFFSIGTNDLIQYTLAIDRVDDSVNYLYEPLHPAVLRLIKTSIIEANKAGKAIGMCGEMASDPRYIRLLLGLGLRTFSVNPESFLEIKKIIANTDMKGLSRQANRMLRTYSQADMISLLDTINN